VVAQRRPGADAAPPGPVGYALDEGGADRSNVGCLRRASTARPAC